MEEYEALPVDGAFLSSSCRRGSSLGRKIGGV